ncbi:MAG: hypothetical protein ACYTG0_37660 [Planctomycetota bacterium]|jgi:hypothetical protein
MSTTEPTAEYCANCNQPATAAWRGNHTFGICPECAVDVLPALIADAVSIGSAHVYHNASRAIDSVVCRFWRAMACRIARETGRL